MSSSLTTEQLRQLVSEKYSLVKTLRQYNPDGRYTPGQTCYCPFHDNVNSPAAAIYDDDNGERLFCFSERKMYTSADALEVLLNYDVYNIGLKLWQSMSPLEKTDWLSTHGKVDLAEAFKSKKEEPKEKNLELEVKAQKFKTGKISLSELLDEYIK